ncbi:class I adenylate-forming enzyme family protein [Metapseudomonas otitidis]|uniref:class I adenylate-forming enzyme family protein n=1 Tax=Metapseudomonas otitidis TaxID=319939 RepID=UPI0008E1DE1E|nr:class I adenylate-forming enzyme family protein [Pseudomonas otitidis]SFA64524.1 long-chain acyl-CoA synthetase [Pseudomonas otitidis]
MSPTSHPPGFLHRFLDIARAHPDHCAIRDLDSPGSDFTYAQLHAHACLRNGALAALGLEPGERVALALPNGAEFIAFYLALLGRGAVPVILNYKLTPHEMGAVMDAAQPVALITLAELAEEHAATFARAGIRHCLLVDGPASQAALPANAVRLDGLTHAPAPLALPEGNPIASLQYTYRGLGRPLGVPHRYLDLTLSSDGLHEHFHPQGLGSVHLVTLPLYAIFGLSVMLVFPLSIGATLLMTNTLLNRDLAEVLAEHQVSFACLVPDVIRYFNLRLAKRKTPPPPLHPELMLYSGGSHLPADEGQKLGELLGCRPVLQGYGLTESMPMLVQSSLQPTSRGAMGLPIRHVQVRVVNSRGEDVRAGQIGELLIKGPMVIEAYDGEPEVSARFIRDGWLHTGDLVWQDDSGHLFFYCQRLRISKIKAQMIDFAEIEAVALRHPAVTAARAYVVPDAKAINVLHLAVQCTDEVAQGELNTLLARHLSGFKLPRVFEILTLKERAHAS